MSDNQSNTPTSTFRDKLVSFFKALVYVALLAAVAVAAYFYMENGKLEQSLEVQGQQLTATLKKYSDLSASTKSMANDLTQCKQTNESTTNEIEKLKSDVASFAKQASACTAYKKHN